MRTLRNWMPTLGWLAATATSIALASAALLPVLRTAPAGEETLASVHELRRGGAGDEPPLTVTTPAQPTPSVASPSSAPPSAAATPTPSAGAPRTTTTRDGWTVTTDAAGVATYLRSFRVEGGQTVVRASRGRVQLVTATPGPGYSAKTVQNTPDNLAVFFLETNHHFVIHVVWRDDAPFAQVSEIGG
ncbi:hypothetical protein ACN26Y_24610 [Micromonospora sp. WMMD558]|uniref:hypothetical protein n=1 Tax=unclassified Micromonospora TaxID=2617518 RepID=UPI0012B4E105|nr:hypothetical protein [Micromonospora sp. WMMC415]QGN49170.1 hypothetical protein GKC29_21625 [Micromonospora sp. WMMC415]